MKTEKNTDISAEEISQALSRIISTTDFEKAYRLRQLLEHLVNKQLAGEADDLKGYNLGLDVFDKGKDFDPDTDTIVRVQMVRLRRMLEHYYLTTGKDDAIIIEIPKGRYVPSYRRAEVPEDDDHSELVADAASTLFSRVKNWISAERYKFAAGLGVFALLFAVPLALRPTVTVPTQQTEMISKAYRIPLSPSIAVFPFNNETEKREHTALIRGFPAHIIHALTRYKDLFILAPDTTLAVRDKQQQNLDKARGLNAAYILSGGFSINGDRLSVSAFLRNTQSGQFVWTKDYEKHLTGGNLHEVQNNIAASVARELGQPYGIINRIETSARKWNAKKSFTAYECVLRFFEYAQNESVEQHLIVRNCLEEAVLKSPEYAQAWAALSWMYVDEHRHRFNPKPKADPAPLDRAYNAARKAVVLDPTDAFNFQYLATTLVSRGEMLAAQDAIMKASGLNPGDAGIIADVGWITKSTGDLSRAFFFGRKAIRLNPGHPPWYLETPFLYYYKNQDCRLSSKIATEYHRLTPKSILRHVFVVVSGMLCKNANIEQSVKALNGAYSFILTKPRKTLADHAIPAHMFDEIIAHLQEAGVAVDG